MPHVPGVNKENFIGTVAELTIGFVSAQKPQAGGYLRVQEKFRRQVHDAVNQSGFHKPLSDFAFAG